MRGGAEHVGSPWARSPAVNTLYGGLSGASTPRIPSDSRHPRPSSTPTTAARGYSSPSAALHGGAWPPPPEDAAIGLPSPSIAGAMCTQLAPWDGSQAISPSKSHALETWRDPLTGVSAADRLGVPASRFGREQWHEPIAARPRSLPRSEGEPKSLAALDSVYRREREIQELGEGHFLDLADKLASTEAELTRVRAEAREHEASIEQALSEGRDAQSALQVAETEVASVRGSLRAAGQELHRLRATEARLRARLEDDQATAASRERVCLAENEDVRFQRDEAEREVLRLQHGEAEVVARMRDEYRELCHELAHQRQEEEQRVEGKRLAVAAQALADMQRRSVAEEVCAAAECQRLVAVRAASEGLQTELEEATSRWLAAETHVESVQLRLLSTERANETLEKDMLMFSQEERLEEEAMVKDEKAAHASHQEQQNVLEEQLGSQLEGLTEALNSAQISRRTRAERDAAGFRARLAAEATESAERSAAERRTASTEIAQVRAQHANVVQVLGHKFEEESRALRSAREEVMHIELRTAAERADLRIEAEVRRMEADMCESEANAAEAKASNIELMLPGLREELTACRAECARTRSLLALGDPVRAEADSKMRVQRLRPELLEAEVDVRSLVSEVEAFRLRAKEVAPRSMIADGRVQALEREHAALQGMLGECDGEMRRWEQAAGLYQLDGERDRRIKEQEADGLRRAARLQQKGTEDLRRQRDDMAREVERMRSELEGLLVGGGGCGHISSGSQPPAAGGTSQASQPAAPVPPPLNDDGEERLRALRDRLAEARRRAGGQPNNMMHMSPGPLSATARGGQRSSPSPRGGR
eukprot:gnl/TRDRNA2_/TRDRNA2_38065_c0_seq1.p1 gnl/TRDRNA2_/TRDRNA2_38065_c0~~gnl/TRDRNA2_/TRDRNA2_38065_c0_seq1.p1  ORF type:complete len:827 (+),score=193.01 gnl/TRDRNA2_/TRDRNA2_38065_c0_seq1:124-2604(+)